jgi:hypothetical protein
MNIPGVHPTGPYHQANGGFQGNVSHKITVGMARWHELLGPQPPDMVLLNANLWDLIRILEQEPIQMNVVKGQTYNILADRLPGWLHPQPDAGGGACADAGAKGGLLQGQGQTMCACVPR